MQQPKPEATPSNIPAPPTEAPAGVGRPKRISPFNYGGAAEGAAGGGSEIPTLGGGGGGTEIPTIGGGGLPGRRLRGPDASSGIPTIGDAPGGGAGVGDAFSRMNDQSSSIPTLKDERGGGAVSGTEGGGGGGYIPTFGGRARGRGAMGGMGAAGGAEIPTLEEKRQEPTEIPTLESGARRDNRF